MTVNQPQSELEINEEVMVTRVDGTALTMKVRRKSRPKQVFRVGNLKVTSTVYQLNSTTDLDK